MSLDQALSHARGLRAGEADQPAASGLADLGWGSEPFQQREDGRVLQPRAQDSFQRGVDLGQQAAQPVADAGRLAGEVVVEADDHLQLGDGLVVGCQVAQGVGHGAGGVRDDRGVAGVGLGLAGVEVGDPPHRQPWQIGDRAAHVPGHGQRQGPDGGGLVDHDEHGPVLGLELGEQLPQLGFAVGQPLVEGLLPGRGDGGGVVFALADVQAEEDVHLVELGHVHASSERFCPPGLTCGTDLRHPRYEEPADTAAVLPLSAVYRCLRDR